MANIENELYVNRVLLLHAVSSIKDAPSARKPGGFTLYTSGVNLWEENASFMAS